MELYQSSTSDININPANILLELIEVSIHNILFIRQLYPKSIFCLKKKYGIPIHVSTYTDLNVYIHESLKAMEELLKINQLEEVAVCFINEKDYKVIERFVFNILSISKSFENGGQNNDSYLINQREAFRAYLLKLSIIDSQLKPLPENCIFKICIQTKESGSVALSKDPKFEDFPWIELEDKETAKENPKIIPIRTLETNSINLEMYVEC
uniref:HORMA domain-containing protein n=2 Tax=Clastoptera arizonana TaxID=38151 RepID=A0A1B6CWE3_9HEMI